MPPRRAPAARNNNDIFQPATGPFDTYGPEFDMFYSDQSSWRAAQDSLLGMGPVFMRPTSILVAALTEKPSTVAVDRSRNLCRPRALTDKTL